MWTKALRLTRELCVCVCVCVWVCVITRYQPNWISLAKSFLISLIFSISWLMKSCILWLQNIQILKMKYKCLQGTNILIFFKFVNVETKSWHVHIILLDCNFPSSDVLGIWKNYSFYSPKTHNLLDCSITQRITLLFSLFVKPENISIVD
jgi:hypothetical protein